MKLVVGLGNPGKEYENTRHNVGFIILDNFVTSPWQEKFNSFYQKQIINNETVIFVKPQTYMNLSGSAVASFVNYFKLNPSEVLVIHDDLDLPCGKIRIKKNSSSGGHNGIKDISLKLGSMDYFRLKVGIGNNKKVLARNYVLDKLTDKEIEILKSDNIKNIITDFINNADISSLSNKYN